MGLRTVLFLLSALLLAPIMCATELSPLETSSLSSNFETRIRPLISLIDDLRAVDGLGDANIALPSIVLIGSQSSGKSSTLEAISGVKLPRGTGIVTRVPLILRMQSTTTEDSFMLNYNYKGRPMSFALSYDEISPAIEAATFKLAGDVGVEDHPITLTIRAQGVPDLTLIDLPGLTEITTDGQAPDTVNKISSMVRKYIDDESAIMLVCVSASNDIATASAMRMALEVDPAGVRTVAVLTKPDTLMSGEEQAFVDLLNNRGAIKLNLGFFTVRNRNQAELEAGISSRRALEIEHEFFAGWRGLDQTRCGAPALSERLGLLLAQKIDFTLPELTNRIHTTLVATKQRLSELGEAVPDDENGKRLYANAMVHALSNRLVTLLTGQSTEGRLLAREVRDNLALFGVSVLSASSAPYHGGATNEREYLKLLNEKVSDSRGLNIEGFLDSSSLAPFIKHFIDEIVGPAGNKLISSHLDTLQRQILSDISSTCEKFPKFQLMARNLAQSYIFDLQSELMDLFAAQLERELIVFTNNPLYREQRDRIQRQSLEVYEEAMNVVEQVDRSTEKGKRSLLSGLRKLLTAAKDEEEVRLASPEVERLRTIVNSYISVIGARIADALPQIVLYDAFEHVAQRLSIALRESVTGVGGVNLHTLLVDDGASERLKLTHSAAALEEAMKRLGAFHSSELH